MYQDAANSTAVRVAADGTWVADAPFGSGYLTTIRSDRTGFGPLFDMADSTAPVDKRTVSTVAPQALFLMNHPFVLAQARHAAARLVAEKHADDAARITRAYRVALGRTPTDGERAVATKFLASSKNATERSSVGRSAASMIDSKK